MRKKSVSFHVDLSASRGREDRDASWEIFSADSGDLDSNPTHQLQSLSLEVGGNKDDEAYFGDSNVGADLALAWTILNADQEETLKLISHHVELRHDFISRMTIQMLKISLRQDVKSSIAIQDKWNAVLGVLGDLSDDESYLGQGVGDDDVFCEAFPVEIGNNPLHGPLWQLYFRSAFVGFGVFVWLRFAVLMSTIMSIVPQELFTNPCESEMIALVNIIDSGSLYCPINI